MLCVTGITHTIFRFVQDVEMVKYVVLLGFKLTVATWLLGWTQ